MAYHFWKYSATRIRRSFWILYHSWTCINFCNIVFGSASCSTGYHSTTGRGNAIDLNSFNRTMFKLLGLIQYTTDWKHWKANNFSVLVGLVFTVYLMKANQAKHIPNWIKQVIVTNKVKRSNDAKPVGSRLPSFIHKQIEDEDDDLKLFRKKLFYWTD